MFNNGLGSNVGLNIVGNLSRRKFHQVATRVIAGQKEFGADVAIAQRMTAEASKTNIESQNAQFRVSKAQHADAALQGASDITNRMSELAARASDSTLNSSDREALNTEYQALSTELSSLETNTSFNGNKQLDGSADASADLSDATAAVAGTDLRSQANAQAALSATETAQGEIAAERGTVGAAAGAAQREADLKTTTANHLADAAESMSSNNMAADAAQLSQAMVQNRAGIYAQSMLNSISKSQINLLS